MLTVSRKLRLNFYLNNKNRDTSFIDTFFIYFRILQATFHPDQREMSLFIMGKNLKQDFCIQTQHELSTLSRYNHYSNFNRVLVRSRKGERRSNERSI